MSTRPPRYLKFLYSYCIYTKIIYMKNVFFFTVEESKSFEECKNVEENYEIDLLKNDVNIMLEQTEHLPAKTNSM